MENVELFHAAVASLCLELTNALQIEVNANLYLTPSTDASRTFPWHTDLTDIFVLQLGGTKHWEAFCSPVFLTTNHPCNAGTKANISQLSSSATVDNQTFVTATLTAGDILYLPAHWVHKAHTASPSEGPFRPLINHGAGSSGSLHLTITPKTQHYRCDVLLDSVLEVLPTYMQVRFCCTAGTP